MSERQVSTRLQPIAEGSRDARVKEAFFEALDRLNWVDDALWDIKDALDAGDLAGALAVVDPLLDEADERKDDVRNRRTRREGPSHSPGTRIGRRPGRR